MTDTGPRIRNSAKAVIIEDEHLLVTVNQGENGRFYLLPGGGQEGGETLHQALRRECLEEIGADVEIGELVYLREYIGRNHEFAAENDGTHQVDFMFACRLLTRPSHDEAAIPDTWQIGLEWVPLEELGDILFYPQALKQRLAIDGDRFPEIGERSIYLGDVS